jgi:hypothetical protein
MKKFIIKTICFILPIIIIGISLEFILREIPNDYSYKKNYLDDRSNEIQVLILGSSHAFYGLNPIYFSKNTFNGSHVSQSLNLDFEIIKKYAGNFEHLETIILPVSYFTFWGNLRTGLEAWRLKNYIIYYEMNIPHSFSDNSELLSNKLYVNMIKLYNYLNKRDILSCSKLGWGLGYKSGNAKNLNQTGKTAALRHTRDIYSDKDVKIFAENINILEAIIELCNKQDIQVILLTTPTYITYREQLNNDQLTKMITSADQIAAKHPNCEYVNLLADTNFIAEDFYDADHLNEIGAEKLSELINQKLIAKKKY